MKTAYEIENVSSFRLFVRKNRFNEPKWINLINEIDYRIQKGEANGIAIIQSKFNIDTNSPSSIIDNIGAGKTDLSFHFADVFREKGYFVLAFPDISRVMNGNENFWADIFCNEFFNLTDTFFDRIFLWIKTYCNNILYIVKKVLLLIRTSIIGAIIFFGFLLGTGFTGVKYVLENNVNLTSNFIRPGVPVVISIALIVWITFVWDRIKNNTKLLLEWNSYSISYNLEVTKKERATKTTSSDVQRKLLKKNKTIIIIDDAQSLDNESINLLINLTKSNHKKFKNGIVPIGIIFLCEPPSIFDSNKNQIHTKKILSEFSKLHDGWLYSEIMAPDIEMIKLYLEAFFKTNCDKLVDTLSITETNDPVNSGFILQVLFELSYSIEIENRKIDQVSIEDARLFLNNIKSKFFIVSGQILERIENNPYEAGAKTLIKYLLAQNGLLYDRRIIDELLKEDGFLEINKITSLLIEKEIIIIHDEKQQSITRYEFKNPAYQRVMQLTWDEWEVCAKQYRTKLFWSIHTNAPKKLKDPPRLAKGCEPSLLVVDVLWREGDMRWLFGGNADTNMALNYYGLDDGALGKWWEFYNFEKSNDNLCEESFEWLSDANNEQYKYKTSRSKRTKCNISELVKRTASLYFLNCNYEKAIYVLEDIWQEIFLSVISLNDDSSQLKKEFLKENEIVKFMLSQMLVHGPINFVNWEKARIICEKINETSSNTDVLINTNELLWIINYYKTYGLGNILPHIQFVKTIEPEIDVKENIKISDNPNNLLIDIINLNHIHEYSSLIVNENKSYDRVDEAVNKYKEVLIAYRKKILDIISKKDKALEEPCVIDKEFLIIFCRSLFSLHLAQYYLETYYVLQNRIKQTKMDHIGEDALKISEFCKQLLSFDRNFSLKENDDQKHTNIIKEIDNFYNENIFKNSNLNSYQSYMKLEEISSSLIDLLRSKNLNEAIRDLSLCSQLASEKEEGWMQLCSEYIQSIILFQTQSNKSGIPLPLSQDISWKIDVLLEMEQIYDSNYSGLLLEPIKSHISLGRKIAGYPHFSIRELNKARNMLRKMGKSLPKIFEIQISIDELDKIGNSHYEYPTSELLSMALEAHNLLRDFDEDNSKNNQILEMKANCRWWISEALSRLCSEDKTKTEESYLVVKPHLNWIRRLIDNKSLDNIWITKVDQMEAAFLAHKGDYKKANELLTGVYSFYQSYNKDETYLLELLQTLNQIILCEMHEHTGQISNINALLYFLRLARKLNNEKRLSVEEITVAINSSERAIIALMNFPPNLLQKLLPNPNYEIGEIFQFEICELLNLRASGQAAIILNEFKDWTTRNNLGYPEEFSLWRKRCVMEWDPRIETTNKSDVERALRELNGIFINKEIEISENSSFEKRELIIKSRIQLSQPSPSFEELCRTLESQAIVSSIKNSTLEDIVENEDIEILKLLQHCYISIGNTNKALITQNNIKKIENMLASKTYFEIAEIFKENYEIREKYLTKTIEAGLLCHSKYTDIAAHELSLLYGKSKDFKKDYRRDEGEEFSYNRLTKKPTDKYDQQNCFSLLVLFENDFRRLICICFNNQENGYWKKGIPSDIYSRIVREIGETVKGFELLETLTLGDLFKIILMDINWELIFSKIFLRKEYLEHRKEIIIQSRNKLFHSNMLSDQEIEEFVPIAKNLLSIIQPHLTQ